MTKKIVLMYWQENLDDLYDVTVAIGDTEIDEDAWMHIYRTDTDPEEGATLVNIGKEDSIELARLMFSSGLVSFEDVFGIRSL
jgi:hypothetical protein